MAENILGLLFVTSSSRGRNVFRYPPDPLSPHKRLTQPIYPSSTYTANDPTSNPSLVQYHFGLGPPVELQYPDGEYDDYTKRNESDGDSDSYLTDESDFEYEWMGGGRRLQQPLPSNQPSKQSSHDKDLRASLNLPSGSKLFDQQQDGSRRGSGNPPNGAFGIDDTHPSSSGRFVESQYNYALDYTLDFLSDMLTPPRAACNRKFEICVDELVFLGHPVSIGLDGKWSFPEEEEVDKGPSRGRRGRDRSSGIGMGGLEPVLESTSPEVDGGGKSEKDNGVEANKGVGGDDDDGPPTLNMFHLVLILDKPDPKPGGSIGEATSSTVGTLGAFEEVYREIAFKWTAAAFALQVKDNYIAKECWEMIKLKEKFMNDGVPILETCRRFYEIFSLDRALNQLFTAICQLQTKPPNPLHAHLPTTLTVSLGDLPISMVLSPRSTEGDEAWAHWGDLGDGEGLSIDEDIDDEDELNSEWEGNARIGGGDLRIEPWQTLLLVEDGAVARALEISNALVGLGVGVTGITLDEANSGTVSPNLTMERRGSAKGPSTVEEDEGALMKALIEACDVTKPLVEIAHLLRYDLDGIVIPLARDLVQNKKAILIDVISIRMRTIVMPTTIAEHSLSLEEYSSRFTRAFPSLPPFPVFIASISTSPGPYRDIIPPALQSDTRTRQLYLDALTWLLKLDLVVQVHSRVRIFARPEVKAKAWTKLWHRRRNRWLAASASSPAVEQSQAEPSLSPNSSSSILDDMITPRANQFGGDKEWDPMDATVPPPKEGDEPLESSYMDYDPDLEMDSDLGEGEDANLLKDMKFEVGVEDPDKRDVPAFTGSFIFKPARAQKDEARWLRVVREGVEDEVWASKFDLCVQYFDGIATFEEISYRTGLHRKELERIIQLFKDDLVTFLHP